MREIKFRAWDKKEKQMHYGWGCYTDQSAIQHILTDTGEKIPGILMQFTGLLDKNGKEIYEGDILKYDETENILITCNLFHNSLGMVDLPLKEQWQPLDSEELEDCEIIGNIYENPELISNK